jgi:succinate dehydrogenase / fumarate reductase, membrane anchor subunit
MSWHSQLGVQVVIEDYVHGVATKGTLLLLSKFGHLLLAAGGSYAVLRVAVRGF